MGISHYHRDRFPPSKLLHGIDVRARLHESRGKGMAQIMKPKAFHVCFLHGPFICSNSVIVLRKRSTWPHWRFRSHSAEVPY
jgi:hypothetical protein